MKAKKGQSPQSAKNKKELLQSPQSTKSKKKLVESQQSAKSKKKLVESTKNDAVETSNDVPLGKSKKALNKEMVQENNSNDKKTTPILAKAPSWSLLDLNTLLDRLDNILPSVDEMKFSKREHSVDWKQVCFGSHTPTDCKDVWQILRCKQLLHRTFEEILETAEDFLINPLDNSESLNESKSPNSSEKTKSPKTKKSPGTEQGQSLFSDANKEPVHYFALEVKEAVEAKYPGAKNKKITKIIKKMFGTLPASKKEKYIRMAESQAEGLNGKVAGAFVRKPPAVSSDEEMEVNNRFSTHSIYFSFT